MIAYEGNAEQVEKAFEMLKSIKGAQLPALHLPASPDACYSTLAI